MVCLKMPAALNDLLQATSRSFYLPLISVKKQEILPKQVNRIVVRRH